MDSATATALHSEGGHLGVHLHMQGERERWRQETAKTLLCGDHGGGGGNDNSGLNRVLGETRSTEPQRQ